MIALMLVTPFAFGLPRFMSGNSRFYAEKKHEIMIFTLFIEIKL